MHLSIRTLGILAALLAAAACGGSSGASSTTGPSSQTLAGTWKATKAEFVSTTNANQRVEIVSLGTTVMLTLDASGTYTQKITDPGQAGQTTTGTWTASQDTLTLKPAGMTWNIQFDMKLSASLLSLSGGHVAFDINLDGQDEETLAYLTLTRQ
jgi:hypothetical protein